MKSETLRGPYRRLLEHYETWPIFDVSHDLRFTRTDAINQLHCANWVAFKKLERLLKKLKIRTPRQLFVYGPQRLIKLDGIGHITLYVAMCILDHADYDVTEWWGWHEAEKARSQKSRDEHEAERQAQASA